MLNMLFNKVSLLTKSLLLKSDNFWKDGIMKLPEIIQKIAEPDIKYVVQ